MNLEQQRCLRRALRAGFVAALCFAGGCGEVSPSGSQGGGAGGSASGQPGAHVAGSSAATAGTKTSGAGVNGSSGGVAGGSDAAAGTGGADATAPEPCVAATGDGETAGDDAGEPVGPPPSGYLVYMAETQSLGKQVFHVRIHDAVVESPVRLTPDAGIDGFSVSRERPATITVTAQESFGKLLTLVDFDGAGATGSLSLNSLGQDASPFDHYELDADGSLLFASRKQDLLLFDLQQGAPAAPQQLSGYDFFTSYGWSGSHPVFSATKAGAAQREVFMAVAGASPLTATLLTADGDVGAPRGFWLAPNHERAIYTRTPSSGDAKWYLLDLTVAVPAPVQLTSAALGAPVSLGISAWSPNSRYYVAEVEPGVLVLVDVNDPSSGRVVSAEAATHFTFASFSPDSQRLVYVASHNGSEKTQLYGVALGADGTSAAYPLIRGTEEEQEAYVNAPGLFEWMYGSRYVYFLGQNPHAFYLADASGCSGRRVALKSEDDEAVIQTFLRPAPNARRAAFFAEHWSPGNHDLYVADIDDDGSWDVPTRISEPGGTSGEGELTFLDPDWLMYYEGDAERRLSLYLAPRDGSTPARLLSNPNEAVVFTQWLPDER